MEKFWEYRPRVLCSWEEREILLTPDQKMLSSEGGEVIDYKELIRLSLQGKMLQQEEQTMLSSEELM